MAGRVVVELQGYEFKFCADLFCFREGVKVAFYPLFGFIGELVKVVVDGDLCIGCELCVGLCPEVFTMKGGKAKCISENIPKNDEESCSDAAESCPVHAIKVSQ